MGKKWKPQDDRLRRLVHELADDTSGKLFDATVGVVRDGCSTCKDYRELGTTIDELDKALADVPGGPELAAKVRRLTTAALDVMGQTAFQRGLELGPAFVKARAAIGRFYRAEEDCPHITYCE